jgi:hypothetical protein
MTLKDAVLKSLEDLNEVANHLKVLNHIVSNNYYDFGEGKTPAQTVSAVLGDFIRNNDTRVKRIKHSNATYSYYLTKNEDKIPLELLAEESTIPEKKVTKSDKEKNYDERSLHKLLSTYLNNTGIFSKTIYHEMSTYVNDSGQTWTHPDMVGIKFLKLQSKASQDFLKSIKSVDTLKLYSYELKREINNDSDLKKAYFQAVSNSSWANYGYLVAFEFGGTLFDEMERLNQSFGIGIIKLNSNPYKSQILFSAKYRDLDFKTIDKVCKINKEFEKFIEQTEKLMTAEERYYKSTEKELSEFCDTYLKGDAEIESYCKEKFIPLEKPEEQIS